MNKIAFEELLEVTKVGVLERLAMMPDPSSLSGAEFEQLVYEVMTEKAAGTPFMGTIVHTGDRVFPDIVMGEFGVEVKATKKDDWTSVGNSVLESSRAPGVEEIYMFFGKLGGIPGVVYRQYEACLKGIAVTHYPRYQIDMLLDEGDSIFDKMEQSYDEMRQSSRPIKTIRSYYRQQLREGDSLWWIDDETKDAAVSPIIRNFSSLDRATKEAIEVEMFVLFPEIFGSGNKKYERIPGYLAAKYGVVSASLRDNFTAGGKEDVFYKDMRLAVPQMIAKALRLKEKIITCLAHVEIAELCEYWDGYDGAAPRYEEWLRRVDHEIVAGDVSVRFTELFDA